MLQRGGRVGTRGPSQGRTVRLSVEASCQGSPSVRHQALSPGGEGSVQGLGPDGRAYTDSGAAWEQQDPEEDRGGLRWGIWARGFGSGSGTVCPCAADSPPPTCVGFCEGDLSRWL